MTRYRDKMQRIQARLSLIFCTLFAMQMVGVASSEDNLNRCLNGKHHKKSPGKEGAELKNNHCSPWAQRSCCTNETAKSIEEDGVLTLYNMKWDHCSRNLSSACRDWFIKDTCFYECSPNIGPFIVQDRRSRKTRKERVINVPLCSSDCDAWFEACKSDLTCSDNWGKNWNWTKQGNQCIKECKTFKEYFQDSQNFCNNIFDRSFEYAHGTPGEDCFSLWPNVSESGVNPNEKVAKAAQKSQKHAAVVGEKVVNFLDRCIKGHHKSKPGPELDITECVPWRSHACCSKSTTDFIKINGSRRYSMVWEPCGKLSKKCHDYFIKDACFYHCSPNLAPWIVKSVAEDIEKTLNVPLCSGDCDGWFEACKDDFTCSDNWEESREWVEKWDECNLKCKRFKDYFKDPVTFCNKIFNHSFVYTDGVHGKDCMSLWPDSDVRDLNRDVAITAALKILKSTGNASKIHHISFIVYAALLLEKLLEL